MGLRRYAKKVGRAVKGAVKDVGKFYEKAGKEVFGGVRKGVKEVYEGIVELGEGVGAKAGVHTQAVTRSNQAAEIERRQAAAAAQEEGRRAEEEKWAAVGRANISRRRGRGSLSTRYAGAEKLGGGGTLG